MVVYFREHYDLDPNPQHSIPLKLLYFLAEKPIIQI